jgi:hypothetical protein
VQPSYIMRERATSGAPVAIAEEIDCSPDRAEQAIYDLLGNGKEITKAMTAAHLTQDVLLQLGPRLGRARVTLIPVSWRVPNSNAFPGFKGFFQITSDEVAHVSLALWGRYVPPFGGAGALFDAVAGRHVALATIHRLLSEVIQSVELKTDPPVTSHAVSTSSATSGSAMWNYRVVGVIPNSSPSQIEHVVAAANIDPKRVHIVTADAPSPAHEDSPLAFIHVAEFVNSDFASEMTHGTGVLPDFGGTRVPGLSTPMRTLDGFTHRRVDDYLEALLPRGDAEKYNDAIADGRSVIICECSAEEAPKVRSALETATVRDLRIYGV